MIGVKINRACHLILHAFACCCIGMINLVIKKYMKAIFFPYNIIWHEFQSNHRIFIYQPYLRLHKMHPFLIFLPFSPKTATKEFAKATHEPQKKHNRPAKKKI